MKVLLILHVLWFSPMAFMLQIFFVITTAACTRYSVENFQLICYAQRVNGRWQYDHSDWFTCFKMAERSDGCSFETFLALCATKKRLQIRMNLDYYMTGAQEDIDMFSR